jgi:Regulator of chromosome condensation (RCC1) repeat
MTSPTWIRSYTQNNFGQTTVPALPSGLSYVEIAANFGYTVARRSDGSVVAWGTNSNGQTTVPALTTGVRYVEVAAGLLHTVTRTGGTLDLLLKKGELRDETQPGKDTLSASGKFTFSAQVSDGVFEPTIDAVQLALGSDDLPLVVVIPAGDAGWKSTAKGKHTWKSALGVSPKVKLVLDTDKLKFSVDVSKFDFAAAMTNPMRLELFAGDDHGSYRGEWKAKSSGKYQYKKP